MYVNTHPCEFVCVHCNAPVLEAVVTTATCVFTAPVQALHEGLGHTVVLMGTSWFIRCGRQRPLHPLRTVHVVDGTLRTKLTDPQPPPGKRR